MNGKRDLLRGAVLVGLVAPAAVAVAGGAPNESNTIRQERMFQSLNDPKRSGVAPGIVALTLERVQKSEMQRGKQPRKRHGQVRQDRDGS